jgi:hypothetical protein
MAIRLGKHSFTGPFESAEKIKDRSGVYAIVCKVDNEYFLFDVGESLKLRTKIENHYKNECWTKNSNGQLTFYAHYTPFLSQRSRMRIEQEIRELFHPDFKVENRLGIPNGYYYLE